MQRARTKIVATLGPATSDRATIAALIRAGMNVARLNFSHGSYAEHAALIRAVREAAADEGQIVAILQDLQGPRIRLGEVAAGTLLEPGQRFVLDTESAPGNAQRASMSYARQVAAHAAPQHRVLIDDGRLELEVVRSDVDSIVTTVRAGGALGSRKGVNLPDTALAILSPTDKDRADVLFGISHDVDFIALSFVSNAAQVRELQAMIRAEGSEAHVVAKIERPEAVTNIAEIVAQADAIMVARGDLALEIGATHVPVVQKKIILAANEAGVPVITATQMLESMIREPKPTRAETSDVANAIFDGSDAVMLSGETAVGRYPVGSVAEMTAIAMATERELPYRRLGQRGAELAKRSIDRAICEAAVEVARRANAAAVIAVTSSGATPRAVSVYRPEMPIVGASHRIKTCRRLALVWGVTPLFIGEYQNTDEMVKIVIETAERHGIVADGERIVITSGQPIGHPGSTNMVQVRQVGDWIRREALMAAEVVGSATAVGAANDAAPAGPAAGDDGAGSTGDDGAE